MRRTIAEIKAKKTMVKSLLDIMTESMTRHDATARCASSGSRKELLALKSHFSSQHVHVSRPRWRGAMLNSEKKIRMIGSTNRGASSDFRKRRHVSASGVVMRTDESRTTNRRPICWGRPVARTTCTWAGLLHHSVRPVRSTRVFLALRGRCVSGRGYELGRPVLRVGVNCGVATVTQWDVGQDTRMCRFLCVHLHD